MSGIIIDLEEFYGKHNNSLCAGSQELFLTRPEPEPSHLELIL